MKLEETENLKSQYVNRIETNTTNINNIQDSDTDLVEKITEILNIYEKHPNFKGKPSFKKWCNYCRRYGHSISECRQKQQDNQNKPQKYKEPNKSFYQYMKKDQNLPNKNVYSNNSSGKPLPNNTNYTRNQSPYNSSYRGRSPERRNTQNSSQNHYNRPNSRNNYSRSNSNTTQFVSRSNSQSRNNYYPNNQSRNSSYNRNRNYSNNRNRSYSNNRNQNYPNNRSIDRITHIIDQTITDQTIIIKTDHEIIHKIDIQVIIIVIEIIPNHHTGIITIIIILTTATEVVHLNIKEILIKYNQTQKRHQTPQVLMTQEIMNYN